MNEVRDMRRQGWMWADRNIIKEHGRELGPYGIAVYMALCAYAGPDQEAFPSYTTLAETIGCSRRKVIDVISQLEELGLISKEQRGDDGEHDANVYRLLTVETRSAQDSPGSAQDSPGVVHDTTGGSARGAPEVYTTNYPQLNEESAREEWQVPEGTDPVKVFNEAYATVPKEHRYFGSRLHPLQQPILRSKITDLDRFRQALDKWVRAEYSPRNILGLIDCYEAQAKREWKPKLNLYTPPELQNAATA